MVADVIKYRYPAAAIRAAAAPIVPAAASSAWVHRLTVVPLSSHDRIHCGENLTGVEFIPLLAVSLALVQQPRAGRPIEYGSRRRFVDLQAKSHSSQAESGDFETGSTKPRVLHFVNRALQRAPSLDAML